jgi:glycosyltransferase involved in cell wall biosynthesis
MTKHIALISEHASPDAPLGSVDSGGQNLYVAQIAKALVSRGWNVDIFTRRNSSRLPYLVNWHGARIVNVPAGPATFIPKESLFPHMREFADNLIQRCIRERAKYDLVHANFWMSGHVATEIKRRLNIPFVITFHALGRVRREHQREADGFPDVRFEIEERVMTDADRIIAACPQDRQDLCDLYSADSRKIIIVPCGFDPAELGPMDKSLAKGSLGFKANDRIILHVGRLVPRKGVDTVISALAHLHNIHGMHAKLLIVGGSSEDSRKDQSVEMRRLRSLAEAHGLAGSVNFVGRRGRDCLITYYNAADVFVTTPWYEPFGITPVEAMACGTPVIGSKVGGIKFSVRDGETGFLVPPKDAVAVADRLAVLFQNPALYKQLADSAAQRARRLFSWSTVVSSLERVYEVVKCPNRSERFVQAAAG